MTHRIRITAQPRQPVTVDRLVRLLIAQTREGASSRSVATTKPTGNTAEDVE